MLAEAIGSVSASSACASRRRIVGGICRRMDNIATGVDVVVVIRESRLSSWCRLNLRLLIYRGELTSGVLGSSVRAGRGQRRQAHQGENRTAQPPCPTASLWSLRFFHGRRLAQSGSA